MLEQRRAKEKGYITLREAAEISNYAPDYIGQLIRGGKIQGEQVYSSVAWVTTEEEVRAYMSDKSRKVTTTAEVDRVVSATEKSLSYVLYLVIALLLVAILTMQYIFYVSIDDSLDERLLTSVAVEQ